MTYPHTGQHTAPSFRAPSHRRQNEYLYAAPLLNPAHQYQYSTYHPNTHLQYHNAPQIQQYSSSWYHHPYNYVPHAHRHFQPHTSLASGPHHVMQTDTMESSSQSSTSQARVVPPPDLSTPSSASQDIASQSTTPTTTPISTSTPPASDPKPCITAHDSSLPQNPFADLVACRMPFYPQLPWLSVPASNFPRRQIRRRKKQAVRSATDKLELPLRLQSKSHSDNAVSEPAKTSLTSLEQTWHQSPEISDVQTTPSTESLLPQVLSPNVEAVHTQTFPGAIAKTILPVVPLITASKHQHRQSLLADHVQNNYTPEPTSTYMSETKQVKTPDRPDSPKESKTAPQTWAKLFTTVSDFNGTMPPSSAKTSANRVPRAILVNSIADVLHSYDDVKIGSLSLLEPRGLINTGNMCYMNSILQVLIFCTPFYEYLNQLGKQAVYSFRSDTPLIDAMIMFMREFSTIETARSMEQLRICLQDKQLEQYGEAFIPEYVYEVIKQLPRFSSMRRGHQQDAEEFLGFLLEGLHDECVLALNATRDTFRNANIAESGFATSHSISNDGGPDNGGWLEVGPKQKASITRSSGNSADETPITKIFGGKLRSVLRVPGLKDSVTLEPYQPLQLDIDGPKILNITDALKGLTYPETLHGEFNSPRGPGTTATKQVFIETLPPVLILHLKRFQYDNAGGTQKIWRRVGYPLDLQIPKEVFPQHQRAALATRVGGLPKYRLISVVYHHGKSATGGHYTADVRRQDGEEWIRIDDTTIRRIRAQDVAIEGREDDTELLARVAESPQAQIGGGNGAHFKKTSSGSSGHTGIAEGALRGWIQANGSVTNERSNRNASPITEGNKQERFGSSTGTQTPKPITKCFSRDDKVAYILFYQKVDT